MMSLIIRRRIGMTVRQLVACRNLSMKSIHTSHHLGDGTRTTCSFPSSLLPSRSTVSFSSTASSSVEEASSVNKKKTTTTTPPQGQMGMSLFNSLTQQIQSIPTTTAKADDENHGNHNNSNNNKGIAFYTCGPTTYAPAHLGHARTYVCLDILRRVLEYSSRIQHQHQQQQQQRPLPLFVMNITDVDDKILAAASDQSPLELARHYETEFWNDWDALNCLRPHVVTRVTEYVESDIIPYIQHLVDLNMAYITDGDDNDNDNDVDDHGHSVYFDVRAFEDKMQHMTRYGKLAPPSASTNFFNRVEPSSSSENESSSSFQDDPSTDTDEKRQQQKRDDRDFVLWKPRKHGESMYWGSPWGAGRPGWHIECSAMIHAVQHKFVNTHVFAIHAGGVDLKFPHHTNEICQSEAYRSSSTSNSSSDGEWIPHWVHTGHLHIDGQKMSKSLKNFITIQELLTDPTFTGGIDSPASASSSFSSPLSSPADDFRLWCLGLSGSYRGPATFSRERILEARTIRLKLVRFLLQGFDWLAKHNHNHGSKEYGIAAASPNKKWQELDYHLFHTTSTVSGNAMKALLYNDLDGSTFVKQVVHLAEVGTTHLHSVQPGQGPVEAVYAAMDTLQTLLALVGFTDATTCLSLIGQSRATNGIGSTTSTSNKGVVVGGERVLLDEFVEFRNAVRQIALGASGKKNVVDDGDDDAEKKLKKIMQLCDEARDCTFPALGVELMDAKVDEKNIADLHSSSSLSFPSSSSSSSSWRYCLPRTNVKKQQEKSHTSSSATTRPKQDPIPVQDLFRLGKQYAGQFSSYDEHGFPTLLADGSEISNRLRKKLDKKRAAYAKRIATTLEEEE